MRRSVRRRALFAAIAACAGSLALAGSGAALSPNATAATPAFRLDYSFSAVGGKRPPNIVGTRIAAKGRLDFNQSPEEGKARDSSVTTGTVVVELDILTPHPRTEQIRLSVEEARYTPYINGAESVRFVLEIVESTIPACREGLRATMHVARTATKNSIALALPLCGITFGQQAGTERNSRVQVGFTGKCRARRPAAAGAKPLCNRETTFTLIPALTKVKNGIPKAAKVDAAGGRVVWDNCCEGATWKVTVTFKAPGTVTVGKVAKMPISIRVSDVKPEQPLYMAMTVAAPDFRNDFGVQYPKQPSGSKTLAIPMRAYLKDAKEFNILVGFGLVHVTYTYRRAN